MEKETKSEIEEKTEEIEEESELSTQEEKPPEKEDKTEKYKKNKYRLPPTPTQIYAPPPPSVKLERIGDGENTILLDVGGLTNKFLEVKIDIKGSKVSDLCQILRAAHILKEEQVCLVYSPHFANSLEKKKTLESYRIKDGAALSCTVVNQK